MILEGPVYVVLLLCGATPEMLAVKCSKIWRAVKCNVLISVVDPEGLPSQLKNDELLGFWLEGF